MLFHTERSMLKEAQYMTSISILGAIAALVMPIVLILRKVSPAYGMMTGTLVGGLIGVADHEVTHHDDTVARTAFLVAISTLLVAIFLLSLRPFAGISIDPLIALPIGRGAVHGTRAPLQSVHGRRFDAYGACRYYIAVNRHSGRNYL